MSQLEVNKVNPATGTTLSVGDSGDTITITSGATLGGTGSALTALNASNLSSGTVSNSLLTGSGQVTINGTAVALGGSISITETKPTVSSILPTTIENTATAVVITGTGFVTTPTVDAILTTGAIVPADLVSYTSGTSITATFTLPVDGSYYIRVENPDGNAVRSSSALLLVSDAPSWTTGAGTLGTLSGGDSVSLSVAATGDTIVYSETTTVLTGSGAGEMNLTLNSSTGAITGTAPSTSGVYSFTLRATDAQAQTADRGFSITVQELNYYGDDSDGSLSTSGNVTYTTTNKNGSYDADMVVKDYTSLTINAGHTITVDQPCRGLFIYVSGDCVINGSLSMTNMGSGANPTSTGTAGGNVDSGGFQYGAFVSGGSDTLSAIQFTGALTTASGNPGTVDNAFTDTSGSGYKTFIIPRTGAAGGICGTSTSSASHAEITGVVGAAGSGNQTGGGGSGMAMWETWGGGTDGAAYFQGGAGGAGACWSGGGGGAASVGGSVNAISIAASAVFGVGADASSGYKISGSTGNPAGAKATVYSTDGNDGTGGLIFLVVKGDLTIGAAGSITANGRLAADCPAANYQVGVGGASGGGSINILYKGTLSNSGSVTATGGAAGTAISNHYPDTDGGAGGAGTTNLTQID